MDRTAYDLGRIDIAWCPGCGDFGILNAVKGALAELDIPPERIVFVSGIGQAAKLPHYLRCNLFNGLHGRALPPATAIKASNPGMCVIAESGDGDMYGEGGNHLLHTIRRNPDITNIVHDNMVYGLTKGQASPTSPLGFRTPVQVEGSFSEPFNPVALAIAMDASFVARASAADPKQLKEIVKMAIRHRGYALVDVFQVCITYNKVNTYEWFRQNTYALEEGHDPTDRVAAFKRATERGKLPLGVFYTSPERPTFEDNVGVYQKDKRPLFERAPDRRERLKAFMRTLK